MVRWLRARHWLLTLFIGATLANPAFAAPQVGDSRLTVTGVVQGNRKSTADVLIINKTGVLLPMEADSVSVPVPIGMGMPLQLKPGVKHVKVTEYRWSSRGKNPDGWVVRNIKTIDVGLGLRGTPAKYIVERPRERTR